MGAPIGNKNAAGSRGGKKRIKRIAKRSKKLGGFPVKDGYVFTGSRFIPVKQFKHKLKHGY
jgi:hypothetical protein